MICENVLKLGEQLAQGPIQASSHLVKLGKSFLRKKNSIPNALLLIWTSTIPGVPWNLRLILYKLTYCFCREPKNERTCHCCGPFSSKTVQTKTPNIEFWREKKSKLDTQ